MSNSDPLHIRDAIKSVEEYLIEFPTSTNPTADVFLGGSCNPTVWRFSEAIPLLDAAGVSYFNPQVREWHDDLLQKEIEAKENAKVLLFVIDDETRGIASMVEASEYAGRGKPTVLVILEIPEGSEIDGEPIGPKQLKDLNRGRKFLANLAQRHHVPVFDNIPKAINKVIEMTHE